MDRKEWELPLVNVKKGSDGGIFNRTTSVISNPQTSCLDALKENNLSLLEDVLNEDIKEFDVNKSYTEEKHKTLLHIAIELGNQDAVRLLLGHGADPNIPNRLIQQTPLLVAALKMPKLGIMKLLLRHKANVNAVNASGKNVLHLMAKRCVESSSDEELIACLQLILEQKDVNVDKKDDTGLTPLYLAAASNGPNYFVVVRTLMYHGADWSISANDEVIRTLIKDKSNKKQFDELIEVAESAELITTPLTSAIMESVLNLINEAEFKDNLGEFESALELALASDLVHNVPGQMNPLQRACEIGLSRHVRALLLKGVNPNMFSRGTSPPLVLAAKAGHFNVLEEIIAHKNSDDKDLVKINFSVVDIRTKTTVLHSILRKPFRGDMLLSSKTSDKHACKYDMCLNILFPEINQRHDGSAAIRNELQKIINVRDEFGNSPIHYATQLWDQKTVRMLLELGANIGLKNVYEEVPVENILPETMEAFLNEYCMECEGDITNKDFKVTMNYDFLAPPREELIELVSNESRSKKARWSSSRGRSVVAAADSGNGKKIDAENQEDEEDEDSSPRMKLPETEVLWHMSQSKKHRHLLKHPVITTFLWLKWNRVSKSYSKNLIYYFSMVVCLTCYIFALYGGKSIVSSGLLEDQCPLETVPTPVNVLWYVNLVMLTILFCREFLQFGIAPRRYFFSFENWLELILIVLVSVLLLHGDVGCHVKEKRHIAAVVIVLSWSEFITMIGRHPKLSTYNIYVTMFYKVTSTFVLFLAWYSLFIFAFALGFYILLHQDSGKEPKEDEYVFFNGLGLAVVKTFTMFVGELEFSDLPIDTPIGYIFFLSFIFLIVVVMMNLLNGLAVSDTGVIRADAELSFYRCQVDVISYVEAMILGDPFNFLSNWPAFIWLRRLPNCSLGNALYRVPQLRSFFHFFTGASGILLFFDFLPNKRLTFFPNHERNFCGCLGENSIASTNEVFFPTSIVDDTKSKILEQSQNGMEDRLNKTEEMLLKLLNNQSDMAKDMKEIIKVLRTNN